MTTVNNPTNSNPNASPAAPSLASDNLSSIKSWLNTGSINIFGLPMSGKDTVGHRLAEALGAEFLSSGDIIRRFEAEHKTDLTSDGRLAPTNAFYNIVLPHFSSPELKNSALILSSIGRWSGEEDKVMDAAKSGGHEIKLAINLSLSEDDVRARWQAVKNDPTRGLRADDSTPEIFETRLAEFREKTQPVLDHYEELGKLINIPAAASRDQVFENVILAINNFIKESKNA